LSHQTRKFDSNSCTWAIAMRRLARSRDFFPGRCGLGVSKPGLTLPNQESLHGNGMVGRVTGRGRPSFEKLRPFTMHLQKEVCCNATELCSKTGAGHVRSDSTGIPPQLCTCLADMSKDSKWGVKCKLQASKPALCFHLSRILYRTKKKNGHLNPSEQL